MGRFEAMHAVRDAAGALDDASVGRPMGQSVSGLGTEIADYVRFYGDSQLAAGLASLAAKAARRLGAPEGNRLADALDALHAALVAEVREEFASAQAAHDRAKAALDCITAQAKRLGATL